MTMGGCFATLRVTILNCNVVTGRQNMTMGRCFATLRVTILNCNIVLC